MQLRSYQEKAVKDVSIKLASGMRKLIFCLATGGGKTHTFSAICERYVTKSGKSVLVLVDRKELMTQTVRTLYNGYGISAQPIKAGMKFIPPAPVYVGMVESTIKRLPAGIGLVIIDEAHKLAFAKMHAHFPTQFILGFTATPLTSNKSKPLKNYYEDIVCGIDIPELIKEGSLVQNVTYLPRSAVDTSELAVKNGEYDEQKMAQEFSKAKHIQNTVDAYLKYSPKTKCLVFNCSIMHAEMVNQAFVAAGLPSRVIHSEMDSNQRDQIVKWYLTTANSILQNVGILTTGFDAPDTETIIMNRATLSMPLWLQCCGRGSRPAPGKCMFTIIDMGENSFKHGDWCFARNWEHIFRNPPRGNSKPGVAPVKSCPKCDALISPRTLVCPYCGELFAVAQVKEAGPLGEFVIYTKGIDVPALVKRHSHLKEYFVLFNISEQLAKSAKKTLPEMSHESFKFIYSKYLELAKEWCQERSKKYTVWHSQVCYEKLTEQIQKHFPTWQP